MTNSVMFSYEFASYYRIKYFFFTQHKLNIEYFIKRLLNAVVCVMIWRKERRHEEIRRNQTDKTKYYVQQWECRGRGWEVWRENPWNSLLLYGWRCSIASWFYIKFQFNIAPKICKCVKCKNQCVCVFVCGMYYAILFSTMGFVFGNIK